MWSHDRLRAHTYKDQEYAYAHVKRNGHRLTVFKQPDGKCVALSTRDKVIDISPWPWSHAFRTLPKHTSIDGELHIEGLPPSFVKTAIKKKDQRLRFEVFAIPFYSGISKFDCPLEWVDSTCAYHGLPFVPYLLQSNTVDANALLRLALEQKIEGWVLKRANYTEWYKLKPIRTIDAFVTGFHSGKGRLDGLVGSLRCSVFDGRSIIEIANVSGMDDETRWLIDTDKENQVCEIEYQYVGAGRRLIHPRFVRWRDDKSYMACTVQQDEDLIR